MIVRVALGSLLALGLSGGTVPLRAQADEDASAAPERLPPLRSLPPSDAAEAVAPEGEGDAAEPGPEGPAATAATGSGSPGELLRQGNALYEQGRFEEAAAAYRTALAYGIDNEILHYNLGNALFRLGRLGESVLEYERALRLKPGDGDIRANLEFARASSPDIPPVVEEGPVALLLGWLRRPDVNGSALVALLAYLLAAALVGTAILWRRRRRTTVVWGLGLAALLLAVPPALVVATQGAAREWEAQGVILEPRVECRSGPAPANPVLFTVYEGMTVEVIDERPGWWRITLPDGLNGWIPATAAEKVAP